MAAVPIPATLPWMCQQPTNLPHPTSRHQMSSLPPNLTVPALPHLADLLRGSRRMPSIGQLSFPTMPAATRGPSRRRRRRITQPPAPSSQLGGRSVVAMDSRPSPPRQMLLHSARMTRIEAHLPSAAALAPRQARSCQSRPGLAQHGHRRNELSRFQTTTRQSTRTTRSHRPFHALCRPPANSGVMRP